MEAASAVRKIPLDRLVLSPANARKTPPSAAEDAELKASIKTRGLKQNLVVCPLPEGRGLYAVTAGGRRLKALQELAAERVVPVDYEVPCLVEEPEAALETSLMENTVRAAMHPADEFAAMAALIDAGESVEAVATRFGVTERHVRQRLKLGKVAPELLDEFRAGKLSLEVMTAFTLGADHAAQLAAWRQVKDQGYIQPYTMRRLLTQGAVPFDSRLGEFVGAAAYEAAGGMVTRDLFSGDEDGFMDDAPLVRRLAIAKLEAKAQELRPHWAWVRAMLDPDYGFTAEYGRIRPKPAEFPPAVAAELQEIEDRLAALEALPEDAWSDGLMSEAEDLETRRDELIETTEAEAVYAEEDRARAGCIVTIGDDGEFRLYEGLVELSTSPPETRNARGEVAEHSDEAFASGAGDTRPSPRPLSGEEQVRKGCGFSQALVDDLKAHRLQIARAHLAGDFDVAFDLALYALCTDLVDRDWRSRPLDLRAVEARPASSLNDLTATSADRLLEARHKALDVDWLSLPPVEGFAALTALPEAAKQDLFAWCIAATLKPQLAVEDGADPVVESAIRRLAIPFADFWRPTAANYWSRAKKAHGLAIAEAVLGPRWAQDHANDKKATLAAALEQAFDPANKATIGLDPVARDAAAAWLPPGIAPGDTATQSSDGDVGPEADPKPEDEPPGARSQAPAIHGREPWHELADVEAPSADLPAFLTGEEAASAQLDAALAD
jgi:ParB family transcriptional regulator, chromosome partitioning protein